MGKFGERRSLEHHIAAIQREASDMGGGLEDEEDSRGLLFYTGVMRTRLMREEREKTKTGDRGVKE